MTCNNQVMDALLAVLVVLVVAIAGWNGVASRRRRLEAETQVAIRDRELAQLIEATDEGFLSFDATGAITSWSARSEQLFGWNAAEVLGEGVTNTLIPVAHRQAYESGLAHYRVGSDSAIVGKRVVTTTLHRDGHEIPVEMIIWARGEDGFNAFVRELPARDNTSDEGPPNGAGTMIPLIDSLTSLGNRNLLEKDLNVYEGQVARYGLRSCVALIDIDDFRKFNDRYGRAAGDEAIVAVAERLANRSRSGDSVYRVGGDEFICLLPEQSLETGAIAVERMRRNIEELAIPHEDSSSGFLSVSAGLALLDAEHLKAASELLKDAETALFYARNPDADSIEGGENSDSTPSS